MEDDAQADSGNKDPSEDATNPEGGQQFASGAFLIRRRSFYTQRVQTPVMKELGSKTILWSLSPASLMMRYLDPVGIYIFIHARVGFKVKGIEFVRGRFLAVFWIPQAS